MLQYIYATVGKSGFKKIYTHGLKEGDLCYICHGGGRGISQYIGMEENIYKLNNSVVLQWERYTIEWVRNKT